MSRASEQARNLISYGQKTISGTAGALGSSVRCKVVLVKADPDNTDNVFVGDSNVTTGTGFQLAATDGIVPLEVKDPADIFVVSDGTSQKLHWMAFG